MQFEHFVAAGEEKQGTQATTDYASDRYFPIRQRILQADDPCQDQRARCPVADPVILPEDPMERVAECGK